MRKNVRRWSFKVGQLLMIDPSVFAKIAVHGGPRRHRGGVVVFSMTGFSDAHLCIKDRRI